MRIYFLGLLALVMATTAVQATANEWVRDVEVTQLGTYQGATHHFVWSGSLSQECKSSPTMYFDDSMPGGKALMLVLTTALINKRKVDYQVVGCDILEVYLK